MESKTVYAVRSEGDYETTMFFWYENLTSAKKAFDDLVSTVIRAYTLMGIKVNRHENEAETLRTLVEGPDYLCGTEISIVEKTVEYD